MDHFQRQDRGSSERAARAARYLRMLACYPERAFEPCPPKTAAMLKRALRRLAILLRRRAAEHNPHTSSRRE